MTPGQARLILIHDMEVSIRWRRVDLEWMGIHGITALTIFISSGYRISTSILMVQGPHMETFKFLYLSIDWKVLRQGTGVATGLTNQAWFNRQWFPWISRSRFIYLDAEIFQSPFSLHSFRSIEEEMSELSDIFLLAIWVEVSWMISSSPRNPNLSWPRES